MNIEEEVGALIQDELNTTAASYSFAQLDSLDVIRLILSIETCECLSIPSYLWLKQSCLYDVVYVVDLTSRILIFDI